jgi:hypothetical protein
MVCDLVQKLELLHAAGTQVAPPHGQEIVKTLYEILNVLDSKGLALLAFDGIVVAATTFAAEKGGVFHRSGLPRWLAILVIILCLAGAALCLGVSEISYSFLHYVDCNTPGKLDYTDEITHLSTLVDWRTLYYRTAWWCSIIAIPLFLAMFWGSLNWKNKPISEIHEHAAQKTH